MKILKWLSDNALFLVTLFLLIFIPLYPKIPLLDIKNTWVYVRVEDFLIISALLIWAIQLFRKKITLKTPLTLPIIIFWIIGAVATIHGILIIFPNIANVFPNVAFLSLLRRIEYISLFFVAFAAINNKRQLGFVITVIVITLLLVIFYGFGQKYLGFPAYLTMNEEFAKGLPIKLSPLSRVPSTFAGHYDLAAYLVLIIPILVSLLFGLRSLIVRLFLLVSIFLGFVLLFMTVSRVSFFVLLISMFLLFFLHKKILILLSLPVAAAFLIIVFLSSAPALVERFGSTVRKVDLLVNAEDGNAVGQIKYNSSAYFENKIIERKDFKENSNLNELSARSEKELLTASPSAIFPATQLPPQVLIVVAPDAPTGENLPQGTGYVNLELSPVTKRVGEFFYELPLKNEANSRRVFMFNGDFLVKRASAYDLSFTTRYQGEWPRALEAFKRNILFGSGYGSVSLAVDNNYLRILGEVGILGFISFFAIFIISGIYIVRVLPNVDSPITKSFVLGFVAGVFGLMLNALLIDVFEASKVAFLLWMLLGIMLGTLHFYQKDSINLYKEFKNVVISKYAIIIYLSIVSALIFLTMVRNFYIGDDLTWLRWAADCVYNSSSTNCGALSKISNYFIDSHGFFYRPGTKTYFLLMYNAFWLNQTIYHIASILIHFVVAVLLFILAQKVLRNLFLSTLSAFLFLILSGYSESVFWIAATGHLINAMFILLSLICFIVWEERKKIIYFVASVLSLIFALLFYELGIIVPLLIILYKFTFEKEFSIKNLFKKVHYLLLLFPIFIYLLVRYIVSSHWFSGDYNYNLLKLPFNVAGNIVGYLSLSLFGPITLPLFEALRRVTRENVLFTIVAFIVLATLFALVYRIVVRKVDKSDFKIISFGFLFFVITLLPFLGLGNITSRYSYLSSVGIVLLVAILIKKLYGILIGYGRDIAFTSVAAIISVFTLLHIIQLQQIHSDWYEAGQKVRRFFVSIDSLYADYWSREPVEFYFVDVPIKHGSAWVFPVGLSDALWFPTQNKNLKVYLTGDLEFALSQAESSPTARVFKFDSDGSVKEVRRYKNVVSTKDYR